MKRKGFAIIAAVFLLIVLSALGLFAVSLLSTDTDIALDSLSADETFYIAEAGLQYVMYKLADDASFRDNPTQVTKNFGSGSFTVNVSKAGNTYTLISTATVGEVIRQLQQSTVVTPQPPEAFEYSMYSYGDITMNSVNMTINGDIAAENNIIQWATNLILDGEITENKTIRPLTADVYSYETIADQVYPTSKVFWNETVSGICYVKGDAQILSEVTVNGSIIAESQILINSLVNSSITPDPGNPALVAVNDVILNSVDSSTINGLIYSGNNVTFNSVNNVTFTGSIIAQNSIILNSCQNSTLNFDTTILTDPPPYFSDPDSDGWAATPQADWNEQ